MLVLSRSNSSCACLCTKIVSGTGGCKSKSPTSVLVGLMYTSCTFYALLVYTSKFLHTCMFIMPLLPSNHIVKNFVFEKASICLYHTYSVICLINGLEYARSNAFSHNHYIIITKFSWNIPLFSPYIKF